SRKMVICCPYYPRLFKIERAAPAYTRYFTLVQRRRKFFGRPVRGRGSSYRPYRSFTCQGGLSGGASATRPARTGKLGNTPNPFKPLGQFVSDQEKKRSNGIYDHT